MRSLAKSVKRIIVLAIGLIILGIVGVALYFVYLDSNTSAAKDYLVKTYGINEKELKPKKYIQYVYEDLANCNQEWMKKCTDNPDLEYQYVFEYSDKVIVVSQDKKGNYSDDSNLEPLVKEEDNEDTEEIEDTSK